MRQLVLEPKASRSTPGEDSSEPPSDEDILTAALLKYAADQGEGEQASARANRAKELREKVSRNGMEIGSGPLVLEDVEGMEALFGEKATENPAPPFAVEVDQSTEFLRLVFEGENEEYPRFLYIENQGGELVVFLASEERKDPDAKAVVKEDRTTVTSIARE